jgi:hypothetical protein
MKTFFKSLLGLMAIVLGELLAYYVFTSIKQGGFLMGLLGVLAFISILGGCLLLIAPLLDYAAPLEAWRKKQSRLLRTSLSLLFFSLAMSPFVASVVIFYHFSGRYHDEQIAQFGTLTTVYIEGEIKSENSRHDLYFSFEHEGKIWEGMLDAWHYQVGDSAQIIYSSNNPNEVEWYQKYLEEQP